MFRCFLVVLCALCAQSRLRSDVIPELYRLHLNLTSGLDNPSNSYTGSVSITLNVTTVVQNFTFHALGLQILNTSLFYQVRVGTEYINHDTKHERTIGEESVTISSEGTLPSGSYTLNVVFEGKFGSELEGFYKSSYIANQTERWMASTHFEAEGARQAFPCFDEPSMRAKLILELTLPTELHAVSNMPISNSTILENRWTWIQFAESPPMPTYLMAWYVSDSTFDALFITTSNGITYSVHGRVELKEQGEYAFNVTPGVIAGLESFTGVTYTSSNMSTLGQAAIPDFSAGAMENWGLVTYREAYLLYDRLASSVLDKQHTLLVIAHELTHQWFGNAVTLDWWSYTWLNEGFARYLQYVIPNQLEPSWMVENQFLTDVFQLSMAADLDAHPLTNPNVTSTDEVEDMFDVITYGKGASILRMFSSILGEEAFKTWLNTYLTSVIESGRVAKPDDLFGALPNSSLAEKFRPWTEVAGHPIVNVSSITYNGRALLRLSQMKEALNGSSSLTGLQVPIKVYSKAIEPSISFVPLAGETSSNYNYTVQSLNSTGQLEYWLGNETVDLRLNDSLPEWYLINVDSLGYYRVLYDEENWKSLGNAIAAGELPPLVRAQLVSDALSLLKNGYLQPRVAFDFVKFLGNEKDLLVWKAALMAFKEIRDHLLGWSDPRDELDMFVSELMDKALTISFTESEDRHYEKVLRMYVAKQACVYHTRLCTSLQLLPQENQTLIESVDRDTDGAVLCELVKTNATYWERVFSMYVNSTIPTQKSRYLSALSCTVNSTLQSRLLGNMLRSDVIKLQDFKSIFVRICDTNNGTKSAMNFIRANGTQFVQHVTSKRDINQMLGTISNKLYTNGMLKEMEDLLSQTPALGLTNQEKSDLISKAKKTAGKRQLVSKRVCEGFQMVCVPPQDPVLSDEPSSASDLVSSLAVFLISIAFSVALK